MKGLLGQNRVTQVASLLGLLATYSAWGQTGNPVATTAATAVPHNSSYIEPNGTAHITRVVPVPQDLSPEAQKFISQGGPDEAPPEPLASRRARMDQWGIRANAEWSKLCPNKIENTTLAGVPVRIVTPDNLTAGNRDKVLMNLHGGSASVSCPAPSVVRFELHFPRA